MRVASVCGRLRLDTTSRHVCALVSWHEALHASCWGTVASALLRYWLDFGGPLCWNEAMIEDEKPSKVFEPTQLVLVGFLMIVLLGATRDVERAGLVTLKVTGYVYVLRALFHSRGGLLVRVPILRLRLLQTIAVASGSVLVISLGKAMIDHGLLISIVPGLCAGGLVVCMGLSVFYNLVLGENGPINGWP